MKRAGLLHKNPTSLTLASHDNLIRIPAGLTGMAAASKKRLVAREGAAQNRRGPKALNRKGAAQRIATDATKSFVVAAVAAITTNTTRSLVGGEIAVI